MTTSNAEVLEAKDTTAVANNASPLTRNGRPGKQELEEPVKSGVISSIDHLRLSLLTEPEPDWSPMAELNRSELHMLLKHLLDSGTHRLACPDVESSTSFVNNFGRFCSRYADHPLSAGVAGLAEDLNSAAPENFSVSLLIGLLGGESGDHFAFSHLPELLSGLDVDWSRYDALGHVACSLLAWPECNAEPERIGRLFRSLVLPADSSAAEEGFFATEDVIDVIVAVLEEEWDAVLAGHIAKVHGEAELI